jgi:hypothetical protein
MNIEMNVWKAPTRLSRNLIRKHDLSVDSSAKSILETNSSDIWKEDRAFNQTNAGVMRFCWLTVFLRPKNFVLLLVNLYIRSPLVASTYCSVIRFSLRNNIVSRGVDFEYIPPKNVARVQSLLVFISLTAEKC